jgi:ribosomal protein L13E
VREKKAEKAAEKERQKAPRGAEKAIQLSKKGKRKASRAPNQANKRQKRCGGGASVDEARKVAPAALTVTTRRGRNVNLPSKFR